MVKEFRANELWVPPSRIRLSPAERCPLRYPLFERDPVRLEPRATFTHGRLRFLWLVYEKNACKVLYLSVEPGTTCPRMTLGGKTWPYLYSAQGSQCCLALNSHHSAQMEPPWQSHQRIVEHTGGAGLHTQTQKPCTCFPSFLRNGESILRANVLSRCVIAPQLYHCELATVGRPRPRISSALTSFLALGSPKRTTLLPRWRDGRSGTTLTY